MKKIATHPGIIIGKSNGRVTVQIEANSACASCAAHSRCGFAESKNKTLEIPDPNWQEYAEGQNVIVNIDQSRGLFAVLIAYLLPALLLLVCAIGLSLTSLPEWSVILITLTALALYILLLFSLRDRLNSKFTLTLSHQHSPTC